MDGTELGYFSELEKIGEGGMGQVYKARDKRLGRWVAIKLLSEARLINADRRARFVREAKAASALNHPNIITIHEVGEQDGRTFIVMELVEGKPLNELIPRKGMRLTEALRIAAQVADALTAAHAAGIVHRDLKPGNIMVDTQSRVKVLDFGLAKLSAGIPAVALGADQSTNTLTSEQPLTEEGVILGSVPYMSPEQAEGRPLDTRSDIFSFGSVLYEMITGQRAFHGESRASTLAAVVEKEPQPPSEISSTTPLELDRLIVRCLRKDVNRRSQNMADVKLALEELRDESESGKLARTAAPAPVESRRWVWPAVAITAALISVAAFTWAYFKIHGTQWKGPELLQLSPDDGHSYFDPAISPDGGFVAYVSDRSGKDELWLQQVGGGDPIQLTRSGDSASLPSFFPDGKRIVYIATSTDKKKSTLNVISTLGGNPRVLIQGGGIFINASPILSPDGRRIAYWEVVNFNVRLKTIPSNGGEPQTLNNWPTGGVLLGCAGWTPDSQHVLVCEKVNGEETPGEFEWFAVPLDGGKPVAIGARDKLSIVGLTPTSRSLVTGDRLLFSAVGKAGRSNIWGIRLSPGAWRAQDAPHQLTYGTMAESPASVTATGTLAVQITKEFKDLYLVPLSSATGQPTGVVQRLTRDGRDKDLAIWSGDPGSAYFSVSDLYAVDLDTGKQTLVSTSTPSAISLDGHQVAYSVADGNSYSIRVGGAGGGWIDARVLCKKCGRAYRFSPDGRFLLYDPKARSDGRYGGKSTIRLLDLASGKDRPWLEHPTDSAVLASVFGKSSGWLGVGLSPPEASQVLDWYVIPWREDPVPLSEWIRTPLPKSLINTTDAPWRVSPTGNFFYFFEDSKLMTVRADPERGSFSEPQEVKFMPGSAVMLKPDDDWTVRGPGLVFSREETASSSVWLMKLPR
jgi:serine/threonine protein kinase